jgi:flagellar hook-associated protein 1 FlgK
MLGLFGALDLGARSLQTQRQGVEVAGQNLANVNNPAYARQRLVLQTTDAMQTSLGAQGTGVQSVSIRQVRDALLDRQVLSETSVDGYLDAQEQALRDAQTALGEQVDSTSSTTATNTKTSLSTTLNDLFTAFQSVATSPTSLPERQSLIVAGQQLASRFNQIDGRLQTLQENLNESLNSDVDSANDLLKSLADLNRQISNAETSSGSPANDLRDLRQQKLEDLSKLVNIETATDPSGAVNVSVSGNLLVSGFSVADSLRTVDPGSGALLVETASGAAVNLTSGHAQGLIATRDGDLATLRSELNTLATGLITGINAIHRGGYDLQGNTGEDFFTGTDASSIKMNAVLVSDPKRLQASGVAGSAGDNQVALALAAAGNDPQTALGGVTFNQHYGQTVTRLARSLSATKESTASQTLLMATLKRERESVSGVSIDEEMTDLVKYQKAFEASARLITTINEMLQEVVNLKR